LARDITLAIILIKRVYDKKSLGIIPDEQLKWDKHNDAQCKETAKNIAVLKRSNQNDFFQGMS
jgi:hypothetical protein